MAPYVAALLSGLLMWAAFPPLGWGLLAFVGPVPLLWALRRVERAGGAIAVGFLYGGVFFGLLLRWVFVLGAVAWIPLTIWLASLTAGFGLLVWVFRLWPAGRWWLIVVGSWGVWELLRARFPWGGFPWGSVGYAAAGNPGFIGSVQWVGPSGWTILAVGVAAGIVLIIEDSANWRLLVDPLVVVLMLGLGGSLLAPHADGDPIRVAIIQGGSPCPGTHCQNENQRIYERHLELTRSLTPESVDLVVWAENAFGTPYDPITNPDVRAELKDEASRLGAYILASGTERVGDTEFLNLNIVYSPFGAEVGRYAKRHPVPFGEFVPFRGLLDFIPQLDQVPRDMVPGDEPVVFPVKEGVVGSVISFEGAFPRYLRDEARSGSQLMVVTSNESSYGNAPASDQFIGLTRVNAAAVGQDLVHAAITGKSTFISADGEVGDTTDLFTEEILLGVVHFRTAGLTLYARFGDWMLLVAAAGAVAAVMVPGEGRPEGGLRGARTI
jgi:apolipoprotein N-acyltransferase